jgi:hypothetical protein
MKNNRSYFSAPTELCERLAGTLTSATVYLFIYESDEGLIITSLSLSAGQNAIAQAFEGKPLIWGITHHPPTM